MYLPMSWLKEMVDLEGIDAQTIEDSLFSCGLEVEERKPVAPDVDGIKVGVIKEITPHPDSDHMVICIVDCGEYGTDIQIVTGAPNVNVGDHVPVALPGANVYARKKGDDSGAHEVMNIKKGKLRGVESNGMLCSGEELGIDDDWYDGAEVYGIMMLGEDALPGMDVKEYLELDDEVMDISVTANLPHCQYVYGVARELAALLNRKLNAPDFTYTAKKEANNNNITVEVKAPDLCPRYVAHFVKDVKIERSPVWMRRRLKMCGINSISTFVDITNYVLVEMGQPMHAFDMANVAGEKIVVRRAENGEKIVTLDEKEFTLNSENLVICDGEKAVALAGIMGGLNSEIKDTTKDVLFESAKFERGNIRRSSRALGQSSDSSHRFEKGVDEYTTGLAMDRALHLVEELGCGTVSATHVDADANPERESQKVVTTFSAVNAVLGIEVPTETIVDILSRQNYTLEIDGDNLTAVAPAYRTDIEGTAADLAEDVIKVYGYDNIVPKFMTNAVITSGGLNKKQKAVNKFKDCLVAQGFNELINYSFYSPAELDLLRLPEDAPERNYVKISNPLSENYSIMRSMLAPSVVKIVSHNMKRGNESARVFELANVFIPNEQPVATIPTENQRFAFGIYGEDEDFFTAKGVLDAIAQEFGVKFSYEKETKPFLHPGVSACVKCGGKKLGWLGQLSYEVSDDAEITKKCYFGEIDYDALMKLAEESCKYAPVSSFRSVKRDLALVADEATTCGEIETVIRDACKAVTDIKLFDIYRSEAIGEGKKSMAFAITFAAGNAELMPEDCDKYVTKILKALEYKIGIKLR
ncbi:MAG: phenylalanine--tRNA ligase subunit beta [Clostridia bacterium]|nr:phenylalanine--tRNA ligase subunit beta [Clostridia bacterium]